jgi:hypothetical protein
MTSHAGKKHWYELASRWDGTRAARVYAIHCRCGAETTYHATALTDEALRKLFVRRGWEVGKRVNAHRCPACQERKPAVAEPAALPMPAAPQPMPVRPSPPPILIATLDAAWEASTEAQRREFFERMALVYGKPPAAAAAEPEPEPVAVEPEPEPEPEEHDDTAAADWWLELENKNKAA